MPEETISDLGRSSQPAAEVDGGHGAESGVVAADSAPAGDSLVVSEATQRANDRLEEARVESERQQRDRQQRLEANEARSELVADAEERAEEEEYNRRSAAGEVERLQAELAEYRERDREHEQERMRTESRLAQIERQLQQTVPDFGRVVEIDAIDRTGMTELKQATIGDYEVTFRGTDEQKWKQPIKVEAIGSQNAVARVVKATSIVPSEHIFATTYLGKAFRVESADKHRPVEGFPRTIHAMNEEEAIRLARASAKNYDDDLTARPASTSVV